MTRTSPVRVQYVPMPFSVRLGSLSLTALFLLTSIHPAASAPVKVRHATFEAAEATWFTKRNGEVYVYYVLAYRIDKPVGGSRTRLFVDKSKCRLKGAGRKKLASCILEGRVEKLEPSDLRIDPLLSGARLDFRDHRVAWESPQAPEPDVAPYVDPEAAFADAYLERLSEARGRLYGTRMPKRSLDHAVLSYGADAAVVTSLDELPPRMRFTLEARVAAP